MVLTACNGKIAPDKSLTSNEPAIADILAFHVKSEFTNYCDNVGMDD